MAEGQEIDVKYILTAQKHSPYWFTSYQLNRYQHVVLDGAFSDWLLAWHGVSKGSIKLGPLFFLAYENNMPTVTFSMGLALNIALFAHNSKLFLLTHDQ